jgi:Holliday junction resolvasome RuvABC ATP-dependent DNA helicase subunit
MIGRVVYGAISDAIRSLPPRAMGLRSHALPTEDHLDDCIEGLERVLREERLEGCRVVIGSSATPEKSHGDRIKVLPCDEAAAEATRLRNEVHEGAGPQLLYFNTDSTPGESGLDALSEVSAAQIARAFARAGGLTKLESLASSPSRRVRARLDDASVADLADYARKAAERSETHALPLLRFVPPSKSTAAGPVGADAFDALRGTKAVSGLTDALTVLRKIEQQDGTERAAAAQALLEVHGELDASGADPLRVVIRLCEAAVRYARGETDEAQGLCGLTAELARALRRGKSGVERLLRRDDSQPTGPDAGEESTKPMSEEEIINEFGAEALTGVLMVEEEEERVSIETSNGRLVIRPRRNGLSNKLFDAFPADFWLRGGALECEGDQPAGSAKVFTSVEKALADADDEFRGAAAHFHKMRADLLEAASGLGVLDVPSDSQGDASAAAPDYTRALALLDSHPLTVATHLRTQCVEYVKAYERLARVFSVADTHSANDVSDWITDLDLLFSHTAQRVQSATLLPTHPLRIAHSLLWIDHGVRAPAMPPTLAVHFRHTEHLMPQGRDYSYAALRAAAPGESGIALAAREGLRAIWGLLRSSGLVSGFEVELIDVTAPAAAIDALCATAAELLEEDAEVPGTHVNIRCAYSNSRFEPEVYVPTLEELSSEAQEFLVAPRGDGISVSLIPNTVAVGGPAHLAVQAIEVPFVQLADEETLSFPAAELVYSPSRSGAIAAVEVSGNTTLSAYESLLEGIDAQPRRRGIDPSNQAPEIGRAMVKSLVALRGWPVRPNARTHLLTYEVASDDHVVATLAAPELFAATISGGLERVTRALPPDEADPERLRDGVVAMYACRAFFRSLVSEHDPRHLRGAVGLLRAFNAAKRDAKVPALVLSIDGPEGQRWARRMARFDGGAKTRADLLMLEADPALTEVLRIRVTELKARGSSKELSSPSALAALAKQAQITAARIRACFSGSDATDQRDAREALRRLIWMGAGSQLLARDWQRALMALDARLREGRPPEILTECWIVPEDPWSGDERFELTLDGIGATGEQTGVAEVVAFRVLPAQPADPDSPEDGGPPASDRSGPPASGPPASGPPASGPPASGPPASGPASGPPASGPPASGPPASGPAAPASGPSAPASGPSAPASGPSAPASGPSAPVSGPSAPASGPRASTPLVADGPSLGGAERKGKPGLQPSPPLTSEVDSGRAPVVPPADPPVLTPATQQSGALTSAEGRLDNAFDGFVGNSAAVNVIRNHLLYALNKGYTRIDSLGLFGPKSTGKTELAGRIGRSLDIPVLYLSEARVTKADDLADQIRTEVQTRGLKMTKGQTAKGERADFPPPMLVFIDEVHLLKDKVQDALLTALEPQDRVLRAKGVSIDTTPLTFVIATTDKGALREAFRSRVRAIDLIPYTVQEVVHILVNRRTRDPEIDPVASTIPEEGLRHIAVAARAVPRQAISLLKEVAMVISLGKLRADGAAIFDHLRKAIPCDENGLMDLDWRYLKILQRGAKGLKTLVSELGVDQTTVDATVEPYLLGQGWIEVTPNGRVLTQRGWALVRGRP